MTETIETIETTVAQIAAAVPSVAAAHEEYLAARKVEQAAEAELLRSVIVLAKPALRAISTRPQTCSDWREDEYDERRTERASWAGLYLAGEGSRPGPEREGRRGPSGHDTTDGTYGGTDLFLCADGELRSLSYEGTWSNWQGSYSPWRSTEVWETPETVVGDGWAPSVAEIVGALAQALQKEADGKRPERSKAARERAAKLSALAALLQL